MAEVKTKTVKKIKKTPGIKTNITKTAGGIKKQTVAAETKKAAVTKKTVADVKTVKKNKASASEKYEQKLSINKYDLNGEKSGTYILPEPIFGIKVNPSLIAQAVRVYRANQRAYAASTKTRGEVEGSTRKIYRQKGTGNARHGGIRAPIFVGGGIVFGPKPKLKKLELPKNLRRLALINALTVKAADSAICLIDDLEKIEPKTKIANNLMNKLSSHGNRVFIVSGDTLNITKATRNIENVDTIDARKLNYYDVLKYKYLVFSQNGINDIIKRLETAKNG